MSGGQQQRVALARALAIQPRVLLLDEPLSALDAQVRVQLREEIRRIQTELAITTLFVTHDQEEALAISDRVGVMSRGRLEQLAAPADVYERPATPFVAEFIGVTNSFRGTVADGAVLLPTGARLPAAVVASRPAGSDVRVLVRPGDLQVRVDGAGTLGGVVQTQSFLGPVTRLGIALPEGDVVRVDVPSERARLLPSGTAVELAVDPSAAMLATDA
jgi:putative spermidine/putrescine transport system ATP-binding protein